MSLKNEYAFFDLDDTLISIKSMLSFQEFWFRKYQDSIAQAYYKKEVLDNLCESSCWNDLNRRYYACFAGRSRQAVEQSAVEWYQYIHSKTKLFFNKNCLNELRNHQQDNRQTALVSGSFNILLKPIAKQLGIQHVLSISLEVKGDIFTGNILPPQTIGKGKADIIKQFLAEKKADKKHCYAYGDDISDLPMLELVGHPCVVQGGRGLEQHAKNKGWRIISAT